MKIKEDVRLIEYSQTVDRMNCLTHAAGAFASAAGALFLLIRAKSVSDITGFISCAVYSAALIAVYTISSVYHGLPQGEAKRKARLFDHLAIPLLLAGTSTPCALVTLRRISTFHSVLVFVIAWFCAVFGICAKLFFFEKMKAVVMAVYFVGGGIMLGSSVPLIGQMNKAGFAFLTAGCFAYCIGALFCRAGIKRPWMHVVFHVFTVIGSALHFWAIYNYII